MNRFDCYVIRHADAGKRGSGADELRPLSRRGRAQADAIADALADARERLEAGAKAMPMQVTPAAEPLYIVRPVSGGGMKALFSTHPPIEERVRRLRALGI